MEERALQHSNFLRVQSNLRSFGQGTPATAKQNAMTGGKVD